MFFFLSLALMKRHSELHDLNLEKSQKTIRGRGYMGVDIDIIRVLGAASAYLSILVLALYINSEKVTVLYKHPRVLWLACPILLYWQTRLWLIANRGEIHSDTLVFAAREKSTYLVAILLAVILLAATGLI
jgi:hypothetical protein